MLSPVSERPAASKGDVYEALRVKIITQELPPGARINESQLMREFSIGKTPLRDVFTLLQHDGLIRRYPRCGTIVSPIDFNEIRESAEIRLRLEALVGELAAKRITSERLRDLDRLTDLLEYTLDTGQIRQHITCESECHNALYQATGNEQLRSIIARQQSNFARLWFNLEMSQEALVKQKDHWRALCAALRDGEHDKVVSLNIAHFSDFFHNLTENFL